jgi:hypothetical protein
MKSIRVLLLFVAAAAIAASVAKPAQAQSISSVLLNDSTYGPWWARWDSIYGTSLYTGSGTWVTLAYPVVTPGGTGTGTNYIYSTSQYQTYWYDSSTQINFFAFAAPPGAGNVNAACYINDCYVSVCNSGLCTALVSKSFTGSPNQ